MLFYLVEQQVVVEVIVDGGTNVEMEVAYIECQGGSRTCQTVVGEVVCPIAVFIEIVVIVLES
jgi:hypothetical protein